VSIWSKTRAAKFTLQFAARSARGMFGRYPRECPICGHKGFFYGYGYPFVCDVLCPSCNSLERQRFLVLADRYERFFAGRDVLHFAPELSVRRYLQTQNLRSYKTADLFAPNVDLKLNIEKIDQPPSSYDVVLCSHVLEHVDDREALSEIHRVLREGGLLIAMFPVIEGWDVTYENAALSDSNDRLLHFGQHDHLRFFGRDARERIKAAGFDLKEITAEEPDVMRYGLQRGEKIFVGQKRTG
jgi:SAM-dependent methyltransferase